MLPISASRFGLLEAFNSPLWLKVQDHALLSFGAILGIIVLYAVRYLASPYRKLPPGPRGYPIIGNLFDLREGQWLKFTELKKKYGELVYLNAAGQPIVVLNSQRVAVDLLDRRASIYSDRPQYIVASDIMTGGLLLGLSRYGDVWRRMRKAAEEKVTRNSVKGFCESQMTEAILLACGWVVDSDVAQWDKHLCRSAASMILSVVYGQPTIISAKDHTVKVINEITERLTSACLPGAYLVEFFPWMRYIPNSLARWKRDAEASYKRDSEMFEGLLQKVEENVVKGDDYQSLCAMLILEAGRNKLSSRERSWVAGAMYTGGAETTSAVMAWWTLAMIAYPETQVRAQAEIDAVVGRARLPTFADYPLLPYVRAVVKEILRWRPVAPLSLPHRSTEDDWYKGMFIPKGTICIPNLWHMNHDPEIYGEDVAHFNPARHLDASGDIVPGPYGDKEDEHISYGFGRRQCVGRHVANGSLFIDIAVLLWGTKIERKKDGLGHLPLDVNEFVDHGIVVRPVPFECELSPRFPDAPIVLAQERELCSL